MFRRSANKPVEDAPLHSLPPPESSSLSKLTSLLPRVFEADPPILHHEDPWLRLTDKQKQELALRFLRYQTLKVDKAFLQIERCAHWRHDERPFQKAEALCKGRKTGIPLLICDGRGRNGETLVYAPAGYYCRGEVDHALQEGGAKVLFERLMYALGGRVIIVIDFEEFAMKNVDFVSLKNTIHIFLSYYPELFARIVVTRYPRWLYGTWKCVVPLLDSRTIQKVHWVGATELTTDLAEYFDISQVPRWLGGDGEDGNRRLYTGQVVDADGLASCFK